VLQGDRPATLELLDEAARGFDDGGDGALRRGPRATRGAALGGEEGAAGAIRERTLDARRRDPRPAAHGRGARHGLRLTASCEPAGRRAAQPAWVNLLMMLSMNDMRSSPTVVPFGSISTAGTKLEQVLDAEDLDEVRVALLEQRPVELLEEVEVRRLGLHEREDLAPLVDRRRGRNEPRGRERVLHVEDRVDREASRLAGPFHRRQAGVGPGELSGEDDPVAVHHVAVLDGIRRGIEAPGRRSHDFGGRTSMRGSSAAIRRE